MLGVTSLCFVLFCVVIWLIPCFSPFAFCRSWGKWTGPEDNVYSLMKYEHGTGCWQGPNRSTTVSLRPYLMSFFTWFFTVLMFFIGHGTEKRLFFVIQVKLTCGKETVVLSTSEPSRCEYLMEFTTPAVCQEPQSLYPDSHDHTEL